MAGFDSISSLTIAVYGLGLIGGSLALALQGKCKQLLGVDIDPETISLARELSIVDYISQEPRDILPQADIVIMATPVGVIIELLTDLPDLHPGAPLVMDLGSTKAHIVEVMNVLPERFDPIGGHPMCGKEHSSLENADAAIYQDARFALVPLKRTSERARSLAAQIVGAVGARTLWVDPETHDRWVGVTSHLPYVIANSLASITPLDAAQLAGPGFRSTTRLSQSPLNVMLDILATNRQNLLEDISQFKKQLDKIERSLAGDDYDRLSDLLEKGAENYNAVINVIDRVNGG